MLYLGGLWKEKLVWYNKWVGLFFGRNHVKTMTLRNPPIVEVIFELKWQLQLLNSGLGHDPHYSLLIGRLYDKLRGDYPCHQQLPTVAIPHEMATGIVQHRLRKGENQWPLIQLGSGVLTVNDTKGYHWSDFESRVINGVNALFDIHPNASDLAMEGIMLRYINAIELDFRETNIFQFIQEQMKINLSLHPPLFENSTIIDKAPLGVDCRFTFGCAHPKATLNLRLTYGKQHNLDALIWELIVNTGPNDIPELPLKLSEWLNNAHAIIEDWFCKLIEGDLLERFK